MFPYKHIYLDLPILFRQFLDHTSGLCLWVIFYSIFTGNRTSLNQKVKLRPNIHRNLQLWIDREQNGTLGMDCSIFDNISMIITGKNAS